jgi:glutathione synthase/RimK-type ligase-like ATP-grasp enzyme
VKDKMYKDLNFLILGDKKENRFKVYSGLLKEFQINHNIIDYREIISEKETIPEIEKNTIVKLFSPWYNQDIIEHFFNSGDKKEGFDYEINKGDDFYSSTPQTTDGFLKFLTNIESKIEKKLENPIYVNEPMEIFMGRNKINMYDHFQKHNLPHPETQLKVNNIEDIINMSENIESNTLFLKLHSGSLGRGIAYIENGRIYSATEERNGKFYSNNEIKELKTDLKKEKILQFLIDMNSVAQEGINLAKIDNQNFDFRHYMNYGKIPLSIIRVSEKKITNSALGAKVIRGEEIKKYLPTEIVEKSIGISEKIVQSFNSEDLAIDLGLDQNMKDIYCLEVNFLPGLNKPKQPYTEEINRILSNKSK